MSLFGRGESFLMYDVKEKKFGDLDVVCKQGRNSVVKNNERCYGRICANFLFCAFKMLYRSKQHGEI